MEEMNKRLQNQSSSPPCKRKKPDCNNLLNIFKPEPPSLQSIAAMSIAVRLWIEPGLKILIASYNQDDEEFEQFELEFARLEENVLKKVDKLVLPNLLKPDLINVMGPIGSQLLKCFDDHNKEYCKFHDLLEIGSLPIYWTMDGTIDKKKSLEELIKTDERYNSISLYELACRYCMEEYIPELWEKLTFSNIQSLKLTYKRYTNHLVAYWTAIQNEELPNWFEMIFDNDTRHIYNSLLDVEENMILWSIAVGNPFSLKYFWHKLTDFEKNANIENWLIRIIDKLKRSSFFEYYKYNVYTEMLCFLLSQSNDHDLLQNILQNNAEVILKSLFFDWPLQKVFLSVIIEIMDYLNEEVYLKLMLTIVQEIRDGRTVEKLFRKIWSHSPLNLREALLSIVQEGSRPWIILTLLRVGDIGTVCMMLNKFSTEEKKKIVFNFIGTYEFEKLLISRKWTSCNALFPPILSSELDMKSFKQAVMSNYANELCCDWIRKGSYNIAEQFMRWGFTSDLDIEHFKRHQLDSKAIFIALVYMGDFKLVDRFLIWCFESEEKINQFKKDFPSEDNISYYEHLLYKLSRLNENGWQIFENFLTYCPCSPEETLQLKKLLPKEVGNIVKSHNLKFASLLLDWCYGSVEEINQFKRELLLSRRGIDTIRDSIGEEFNKMFAVLRWFSPLSIEIVNKLKYSLTTNKFFRDFLFTPENQRKGLFYVLDCFVTDCNSPDFDGELKVHVPTLFKMLDGQ